MNPNIFQVLLGMFEMEKGKPATKLSMEKITRAEKPKQGNIALSDSKLLLRNILSSFMVLALALAFAGIFLSSQVTRINLPELPRLWSALILVGLVIAVPGTWFVQSVLNYQRARELDRLGLMTKGLILDKWVRELNGRLVYQVCYQYLSRLKAVQNVDKDTFAQLRIKEETFVLYLENLPHISRLDLD